MKGRLFSVLVAATGLIWASASVWIFFQTRAQVEHVLDTRLQEAARMVSSLASANPSIASGDGLLPDSPGTNYDRQLSCQIWSFDGRLVARSSAAPDDSLSPQRDGLSDQLVNGERWRVFAVSDTVKNIRVLVGDRLGLRERLVTDLIRGLLWPALFILPLLGILTWSILGRGLRPLQTMATDLKRRHIEDLSELDTTKSPPELVPLVKSLNSLFSRVAAARQHERDFTAFAAHELRTPIAGLKIQAQVALATSDPGGRERALRNIVISVDRTSRLVRQLLAIAGLDSATVVALDDLVDLRLLIDDVVSAVPRRSDMRVEVGCGLDKILFRTNRDILTIALRNLYENAINHAGTPGKIVWTATVGERNVTIAVEDDGPGISEKDMAHVRTRFYRGPHQNQSGSGLGLAIVEIALAQLNASLHLENKRSGPGLRSMVLLRIANE
ncbi:ATP-binding protein [Tardiphaga sp.]|uniref:ATP-binding protein n=1 Tax=Tardiphaga sp. TaxID=1926292 RepID=UPI00352A6823